MTHTTSPATTVPVAAVLIAGVGAQVVDFAAFLVLPPLALLGPLAGLVAVLITAGAARYVTRGLTGPAVARTGLAVGLISGTVGLMFGGTALLAFVIAAITAGAGVAGAVAGRRAIS